MFSLVELIKFIQVCHRFRRGTGLLYNVTQLKLAELSYISSKCMIRRFIDVYTSKTKEN